MDTSQFNSSDMNVFVARAEQNAIRANKDPKKVLIRAFIGGSSGGEQESPLIRAFKRVFEVYQLRGIELELQKFTNDMVKHIYHWSCSQLFDTLLAADVHLLPTHLNQGMLALGGTDTWNTRNILENLERLRYHLGIPCGIFVKDPVASQNKRGYLEALESDGLCAPSLFLDITAPDLSLSQVLEINR
jgi:hypothetical protein